MTKVNINVEPEHEDLPSFYWLPKLHRTLMGKGLLQRQIDVLLNRCLNCLQLAYPIQKLPGAHKVVTTLSQPCHNLTRLSQPCHNLVIGLSVPYKVVTTLSQPCIRIVSTLQGCGS